MNTMILAFILGLSGTPTALESAPVPLSESQIIERELKDYPILRAIAECESSLRHTNPDGTVLTGVVNSQDRGLFQINLSAHQKTLTEMNLNADLLADNITYAKYLYRTENTKPWRFSEKCWSPKI
jgi:hypothetical protein